MSRTVYVGLQVPALEAITKRGVSHLKVFDSREAAERWAHDPAWTEATLRLSSGPYREIRACEVEK